MKPAPVSFENRRPIVTMTTVILLSMLLWSTLKSGDCCAASNAPKWEALVQLNPPSTEPLAPILRAAPEIALFDDGRLVWLDTLRWQPGAGLDPQAWRTAVLSVRERIDFRQVVEACQFYQVQLPPDAVGDTRPGASSVRVAVRTDQVRDVTLYTRYAPESLGVRHYVSRMYEVLSAIRVLTQRASQPLDPDAIRVGMVAAEPVSGAVEWPVPALPGLRSGSLVEYRGQDAHRIIETLAKSCNVTLEGRPYRAAWVPVLDVPPSQLSSAPTQPSPAPQRPTPASPPASPMPGQPLP